MSEFDHFMKSTLRVKFYARYTDDFVVVSENRTYLEELIPLIDKFLNETLKLNLHPKKIGIRKYTQGIDFLGYVILPHCKLMRKRTWKRILRKYQSKIKLYRQEQISEESLNQSLQSYLGNLSHADTHKLSGLLKNMFLLK